MRHYFTVMRSVKPISLSRAKTISSVPAGSSLTLAFDPGFKGRYVTVVLPGEKRLLTLCEVEVYGYLAPTGQNLYSYILYILYQQWWF